MDKQLAKSLSLLAALKNNLPQKYGVRARFVEEFNSALGELERISGEDLKEFKVPDDEVKPRLLSVDMGGSRKYSSERYCDKDFISMKVDAVLGYFTLILQSDEKETKLGFHVEESE